jgi:hypothetical protein
MIAFEPRYQPDTVVVIFGSATVEFAKMVNAMTDGGGACQHIENMLYGTPWYPFGAGETVLEATEKALTRLNTLAAKDREEGLRLFYNSAFDFKDDNKDMAPLVVFPEETGIEFNEKHDNIE